jgi:hypothetical protein
MACESHLGRHYYSVDGTVLSVYSKDSGLLCMMDFVTYTVADSIGNAILFALERPDVLLSRIVTPYYNSTLPAKKTCKTCIYLIQQDDGSMECTMNCHYKTMEMYREC